MNYIKKRVLIVDDDPDMCFMLEKRLRNHGFECHSSSTVKDAIENIETTKPDLILLDLMFNGPNGTALLHAAKNLPDQETVPPILVLSGCNEEEVVDYVLDNGASGYIRKPVDPEVLLSMINEYI